MWGPELPVGLNATGPDGPAGRRAPSSANTIRVVFPNSAGVDPIIPYSINLISNTPSNPARRPVGVCAIPVHSKGIVIDRVTPCKVKSPVIKYLRLPTDSLLVLRNVIVWNLFTSKKLALKNCFSMISALQSMLGTCTEISNFGGPELEVSKVPVTSFKELQNSPACLCWMRKREVENTSSISYLSPPVAASINRYVPWFSLAICFIESSLVLS